MDARKWPWKKRSSERSGGESESSESITSNSERYSDEQESMKETVNDSKLSPEVTSHIMVSDDEVKESMKSLTEKLSAALVNVSAKEDLVKQHAKVAEEAVAGWEKAENEVTALKQQLEAAVQQNLSLEVKNSHLDGALKECVRQLRQAKDEQEKRASDGVVERNREWETKRAELEKQILDLEKENSLLKQELVSCYKELEVVRVERDFSTKFAETASKLQLDSIKKVAKLEAECRKLQSLARKSPPLSNHKSLHGGSLRSESGERVNSIISMDLDSCKASSTDIDSWASILISEIDQFKSEKPPTKSLAIQIDMMDDFLEMERLVSLPEAKPNSPLAPLPDNPLKAESKSELDSMTKRVAHLETMLDKTEEQNSQLQNVLEATVDSLKAAHRRLEEVEIELNEAYKAKESLEFHLNSMEVESRTLSSTIDSLKAEIEEERKLSAANSRLDELNEANKAKELLSFQLNIMEDESRSFSSTINSVKAEIEEERKSSAAQSVELHDALDQSLASLKAAHTKIEEMQTELTEVYKSKESLESQIITMEAESRTLSSNLIQLKKEIEGERKLSAELKKKYEELENEIQEYEVQQSTHSNSEVKVKQEDLAMAADKLAECQQTIASLGRQLESLATLEDFFIDTSSIPGLGSDGGGEIWRLPSNGSACVSNYSILANGNKGSSSSSTNHVTTAKKWNSFPELFNRSKSGRT